MTAGGDLLLHACCGPCMTVVHRELAGEGFRVTGYFYNPNIHPWKERERRLTALSDYAEERGIPLEVEVDYPLEENLRMLLAAENRCSACFHDRLSATARRASEMGIERFSTTLSVSPYQDQELIRKAGARAEEEWGVRFEFRDFRDGYRESISLSREAGMYRQPYCGCVFSERDRYLEIRSPGHP
ncbi:MAG: epoxyqueuosine reductase QueH [Candidatus Aegiribacteria sp.]